MGSACSVPSAAGRRAAGGRPAGAGPAGGQPAPEAPAQAAASSPWASQAAREAALGSPPFQAVHSSAERQEARHPHQPAGEKQASPSDEAGDHEAAQKAGTNDMSQPVGVHEASEQVGPSDGGKGEAAGHKSQEIEFELTFDNEEAFESNGQRIEAELRQRLQRPFLNAQSDAFEMVREKTWMTDGHGNKTGGERLHWEQGCVRKNSPDDASDDATGLFDDASDDVFPVTLHIVLQESQQDVGIGRYTDGESVFDALAKVVEGHHPVRLLRMSWLLQMEETVLKRRQELPEKAFISAEELLSVREAGGRGGNDKVLPIGAVSFCWDTREHPDPTGKQLKLILETLKSERAKYCKSIGAFSGFDEMGVFWDWPSLLQGDPQKSEAAKQAALADHKSEKDAEAAASDAKRTPAEKAAFGYALHQTMDLWYAHQGTTVFLLTQHPRERGSQRVQGYEESGWTTYERCSAEQIKKVYRLSAKWDAVLDLGSSSSDAKAAGRRWPVGPDEFDEKMKSRSFTNGADRDAVRELFRKMSMAQLGGVTDLDFDGMPRPEPADMASLGGCLLLCRSLRSLDLRGAQMGDEGIRALLAPLAAAPRAAGPPLPALTELVLESNAIGDAGAAALAAALPAAPALKELVLSYNAIGDAGAEALAAALPAAPALTTLLLGCNAIGDAGAEALAAAEAAAPSLDIDW